MKQKSNFGWLELILGILLIAFGIFALANPASALANTCGSRPKKPFTLYGFRRRGTGLSFAGSV